MNPPLRPDYDAAPFVHPGDAMDFPPSTDEATVALREGVRIYQQMTADCLPPLGLGYRGRRRLVTGWRRWVVMTFIINPESLGSPTQEALARQLGMSARWVRALIRECELTLAMRADAASKKRAKRAEK